MNNEMTGGCACGAVRYVCTDRPIVELICHCRDCQYASGGAFSAVMLLARDQVHFQGAEQRYHTVTTAMGNRLSRGFCPTCGSPVSARWETHRLYSVLCAIHAGSLDDPSTFSPTVEDWIGRGHAWHPLHPDTQKFTEKPTPDAVFQKVEAYLAKRNAQQAPA